MRRQLTTLAAIAALTALPTTAHATDHPLRGERDLSVTNSPDTVLNPQRAASDSLDYESQVGATITNVLHKANPNVQSMAFVAVDPDKRSDTTGELIKVDVNEGDTVLFSKYGGTEVKVEGEEYLILSARDILAVIG
jgi:chaperonin GroES